MMSVASANRTSGRNLSLHVHYTAVKGLHHLRNKRSAYKILVIHTSVGNLVDNSLPHALYKLQIFLMQLL